jgi:hypothetical protein
MAMASSPVLSAPADDTVAEQAFWKMTPSEIAAFVHAGGKTWAAQTNFPANPMLKNPAGIMLYAMPEPAEGMVCRVDALSLSVNKAGAAGDAIRLSKNAVPEFFTAADGFDGKAGRPELADACHRTAIHPDPMIRSGANGVFSAPSPKIAAAAVKAVAAVTNAVRGAGPLPFDLACENPAWNFCDDPRGTLAKVLERKMENVEPCFPPAGTCLKVEGFYGHDRISCGLDIDFHAKDMASIDRVRMSCVMEPYL